MSQLVQTPLPEAPKTRDPHEAEAAEPRRPASEPVPETEAEAERPARRMRARRLRVDLLAVGTTDFARP